MVSALFDRRKIRPSVSTTIPRDKRARTADAAAPVVRLRSTALGSSNGHVPASLLAQSASALPSHRSSTALPLVPLSKSAPRGCRGEVDGGSSFLRWERPEATSAGARGAGGLS